VYPSGLLAEKKDVLSSSQYGFRKSRGRGIVWRYLQRMYRPLLKKKTANGGIDISGAYDNVLIDILCDILREQEVPLQIYIFSNEKNLK
jgi:hypothetical protein